VPFIASWPGHIKPNQHAGLMTHYDVYATLAAIVGVEIPNGQAIDSLDMSDVWLTGAKSHRQRHVYYFREAMAYRSGEFKIHLKTRERTREPETGKREPSVIQDPPLLFDLQRDLRERRDLHARKPAVTQRLLDEFEIVRRKLQNWEPF